MRNEDRLGYHHWMASHTQNLFPRDCNQRANQNLPVLILKMFYHLLIDDTNNLVIDFWIRETKTFFYQFSCFIMTHVYKRIPLIMFGCVFTQPGCNRFL